jgi:hypothetical protein
MGYLYFIENSYIDNSFIRKYNMRFLLVIFFISLPILASAQQNCRELSSTATCDKGWFTIAIGSDSDLDYSVSINSRFGRTNFWSFGFTGRSSTFNDQFIGSFDALKGLSSVDRIGRLSVAAGISIMNFNSYNYNSEKVIRPGITFLAETFITPAKPFGFGVDVLYTLAENYNSFSIRFLFALEGHK